MCLRCVVDGRTFNKYMMLEELMKTLNDWLCDCLCDMVSWMRYIARYPSDAIHGGLEKNDECNNLCRQLSPCLTSPCPRCYCTWPPVSCPVGLAACRALYRADATRRILIGGGASNAFRTGARTHGRTYRRTDGRGGAGETWTGNETSPVGCIPPGGRASGSAWHDGGT